MRSGAGPARTSSPRCCCADADGETVSDEEFENFFFLLSVAGNETLRNAIPGGMLALIEHPDEHAIGCSPIASLLPSAIEEMLRFASPVMCFRRTAAADTELHGVRIRAGDKVVVYYASANHDESVFPEPRRSTSARIAERSSRVRHRAALLPRRVPRPARDARLLRGAPLAAPGLELDGRDRATAIELSVRHQAHAGAVHAQNGCE